VSSAKIARHGRKVRQARALVIELDELLETIRTNRDGLQHDEAARRLARDGPNAVQVTHLHRGLRLLPTQCTSPIVLILAAATVLSMTLSDVTD
jgi:Mg2+-importing ATPase